MAGTPPVFHGSPDEAMSLLVACEHNCACVYDLLGMKTSTCAAHQMLLDQRMVNHLIFARRQAQRWLSAEFDLGEQGGN